MLTRTSMIFAATAVLVLGAGQRPLLAICSDSTSLAYSAYVPSGYSALTPAAVTGNGYTLVASGTKLISYDADLNEVGTRSFGGNIVDAPNPVQLKDGDYAAFVAVDDGTVARVDIAGDGTLSLSSEWLDPTFGVGVNPVSVRRSGCSDDKVKATPAVHLWNYASGAFQATYDHDVFYVPTFYGSTDCGGGTTANRVIAIDAKYGTTLWTFNEAGGVAMDVTTKGGWLDYEEDKLYVGTDRNDPLQSSLWKINVLNGTSLWNANAGKIVTSPVLRDDRIYVGTMVGEIKALNKSDLSPIWTADNGLIPTTSQPFVEFRPPFAGHIGVSDLLGRVWVVVDNGGSGDVDWTASLPTPARSRVAFDVAHSKVYVGALDGFVYQLNLLNGNPESYRVIDSKSGSTVGHPQFAFDDPVTRANIALIAGSNNGELMEYCTPWATWIEDNCTNGIDDGDLDTAVDCNDTDCSDDPACPEICDNMADDDADGDVDCDDSECAGVGSCPAFAPLDESTPIFAEAPAASMTCKTDVDCVGANPTQCSVWKCVDEVCTGFPQTELAACDDRNKNTLNDRCHHGICVGQSECERRTDLCICRDENGTVINRRLFTREFAIPGYPEEPDWKGAADSEYVVPEVSTTCIPTLTGGSYAVVWINLFDQNRLPITKPDSFTMSLIPGSGDPLQFTDPTLVELEPGPISLGDGFLFESSRPGTFYAYVALREGSAPGTPSEPQRVSWEIVKSTGGHECINNKSYGEVLEVQIRTAPASAPPAGCYFWGDTGERGMLQIEVFDPMDTSGDDKAYGVEGLLGTFSYPRYWSDFERFIQNADPDLLTEVKDEDDLTLDGILNWRDFGNNLSGAIVDVEKATGNWPVTIRCPTGVSAKVNPVGSYMRVGIPGCK